VLLSQFVDHLFNFLHEQGSAISFAFIVSGCVGCFGVWCVKTLISGKQAEIDRIVTDRDKFQQLVVEDWKSSKGKGGNKK
jgi:hypothetical protein